MGEFLGGRDDDGLYLGGQAAVCIRNGPFILKIEHVADAPYDVAYAKVAADIHRKTVILNYLDVLQAVNLVMRQVFVLN